MKFEEILSYLRHGIKVTRKNWHDKCFIYQPKPKEIKEKIDETMKNSISFRGLWEDKENYPKDMGSGIGGLIKEGDLWCCPQPKLTIYKTDFRYICSIMAKCDNPGQNSSNWNVNIAGVSKIT